MYVARILYPVKVLGPGNRIAIWMVGCKHGCKGCSNPELWEVQDKYQISIESIMALIKQIEKEHIIDGFTITGGDPFEQPAELKVLIDGKYEEDKNHTSCLIGSDNQQIYYLNGELKSLYEEYMCKKKNQIQNFTSSDGIISVGIHRPNYQRELEDVVAKKGLEVL